MVSELAPSGQADADLQRLASQINESHGAAGDAARSAIEHARQCGEYLIEAKAACGHGNFGRWLSENCHVGERQARKYMEVAREWDRLPKTEPGSDLTIREALALIHDEDEPAVPELSADFRYVCLGKNGLAIVEPIGGEYFHVAVFGGLHNDDDPHVIETKRGIIKTAVGIVLKRANFSPIGDWTVEPFEPRPEVDNSFLWSAAAQRYWQSRIKGAA